jgi:hypothetical protein
MWDASLVSVNIHRGVQPGDLQFALSLGERVVHGEVDKDRNTNDKNGNDA